MADRLRAGTVQRQTYDTYRQSVLGDLARIGRREDCFRQLVATLADRLGSPVDWRSVAWDTFHHVQELGSCRPAFRKRRKVLFKDPFMFHALRAWATGHPDPWSLAKEYLGVPAEKGKLLESVIGAHLRRLREGICFWRRDETDEVDFIVPLLIELAQARGNGRAELTAAPAPKTAPRRRRRTEEKGRPPSEPAATVVGPSGPEEPPPGPLRIEPR
ncbi:MAG: ATP-binding protein [Elusimicrobia bacterium]|nr:ATP-binding protein [Elusimicrobiota bacterium]